MTGQPLYVGGDVTGAPPPQEHPAERTGHHHHQEDTMSTQTESTPLTTTDLPARLAEMRAAAQEEYDSLDAVAYARRAALIGERRAFERALQLTDAALHGIPEDQARDPREILADVAADQAWPDQDDGHPTLEEEHPVGELRVAYAYHDHQRPIARGKVVGYRDGMIDTGGPESGPGPVVETTMIVLELEPESAEQRGRATEAYDASQLEATEEVDR